MRRVVLALIAAVPLMFGTAAAQAFTLPGIPTGGIPGLPTIIPGLPTNLTDLLSPKAAVAGTVVSVDPTNGSFVANAYDLNPLSFIHNAMTMSLPTPTQVTITTDSHTTLLVNGHSGSVTDLAAGDKFFALFNGYPWDSLQTITSKPALFVIAHAPPTPKQVYGFVGTVTGVDTTHSQVTVTVADSLPSSLVATGSSATFTVGPTTLILGGSSTSSSTSHLFGGSLSNVQIGDIVAGAEIGPAGETATQVESSPLNLLLDFPAPPTGSSAAKARALEAALALIQGKSLGSASQHKRHHHRHHHSRH